MEILILFNYCILYYLIFRLIKNLVHYFYIRNQYFNGIIDLWKANYKHSQNLDIFKINIFLFLLYGILNLFLYLNISEFNTFT